MKNISKLLGVLALFVSFFVSAASLRAEIISGKTEKAAVLQTGARDAVCVNLISQGMSATDATEMVDKMSAEDINYYAADSARSQPGGVIVFILVVVVLVLLIASLSSSSRRV